MPSKAEAQRSPAPLAPKDRKGDRLLSTRQTCELLRCSRATLQRRLNDDKDFPHPHPSAFKNANNFWEKDIVAYIERERERKPRQGPKRKHTSLESAAA